MSTSALYRKDTIFALATPVGRGGIGIIRISGEHAHEILKKIFRPKKASADKLPDRKLVLGWVIDFETNEKLDEVLAVAMYPPHTYTREPVAEIHSHSGPSVIEKILALVSRAGAVAAKPGEFTLRAFLNGRINLIEAEAVADIVNAASSASLRAAQAALSGRLTDTVEEVKSNLKEILALTTAYLDFSEDEVGAEPKGQIISKLEKLRKRLEKLASSYRAGRLIAEGIKVAIVGKVNVGKSSLMNRLLEKKRSIVTPYPGTTRDFIEDTLELEGLAFRLVDLAGIREKPDPIESEGIELARSKAKEADILILMFDSSSPLEPEDIKIWNDYKGREPIVVANKIDIVDRSVLAEIKKLCGQKVLEISAKTGAGLEALKKSLVSRSKAEQTGELVLTHERHKQLVSAAAESLKRAVKALKKSLPLDICAVDISDAARSLEELTGEITTDEVLNEIFSKFCIGK